MGAGAGKRPQQSGKTRFVPPQLIAVRRTGPDYRNGAEITGQHYLDTFGFRGGEFGNWMNQNDRQASLNMGFEALKDLAAALQVSDKDIAYQGTLAIAFGARGSGMRQPTMNRFARLSISRRCTGPALWHMNGGTGWTITWVRKWAQRGCSQNSPASMRHFRS